MLGKPHPELSRIRLGLGVGGPIIADMFILAGNLAAVASIADSDIYYENLHY
jgi:hypothetical protein